MIYISIKPHIKCSRYIESNSKTLEVHNSETMGDRQKKIFFRNHNKISYECLKSRSDRGGATKVNFSQYLFLFHSFHCLQKKNQSRIFWVFLAPLKSHFCSKKYGTTSKTYFTLKVKIGPYERIYIKEVIFRIYKSGTGIYFHQNLNILKNELKLSMVSNDA